jgi:hypothetical protein
MCMYFFFFFYIPQHFPLQKAFLHSRYSLPLTCVICFYVYTTDCLLRNADLVLLYAYSRLKCRPILCVLKSVKAYRFSQTFETISCNCWLGLSWIRADFHLPSLSCSWESLFALVDAHIAILSDLWSVDPFCTHIPDRLSFWIYGSTISVCHALLLPLKGLHPFAVFWICVHLCLEKMILLFPLWLKHSILVATVVQVYVYMYVCVYVGVCMYVCVCVYVCMYTCVYVCMFVRLFILSWRTTNLTALQFHNHARRKCYFYLHWIYAQIIKYLCICVCVCVCVCRLMCFRSAYLPVYACIMHAWMNGTRSW